jgi:GT2 family glycosyltransferase
MRLEDVTVIVPTRDEARNIGGFLQSLPDAVRLIVVDDSQDRTPDLIAAQRPGNTLVIRQRTTVTEARQVGAEVARVEAAAAKAASAGYLLFTDADVILAPDYFERLAQCSGYDALYGPKLSTGEYQRYYRLIGWGQGVFHALGIPAVSGSNFLVRAEAFFASGGFALDLTCNEDSELGWRIQRRGFRVGFAPELIVYARDHRRLRRGALRKTLHSLARCALLYTDLMPPSWRASDWGYWAKPICSESNPPRQTLDIRSLGRKAT